MKKIFITGSTTGLGLLAGKMLIEDGYEVLLHARNEESAKKSQMTLSKEVPFAIGDISEIAGIRKVASAAREHGPLKSIIHNAGVYETNTQHITKDGLRTVFAVNVLAPYLLTTLLDQPERMVFLSSEMHDTGNEELNDPQWNERNWDATQAYCDSKLYDLMLAKWFAQKWPKTYTNAVNPGWVPTRMGGANAPDDLIKGAQTQAWLSVSEDPEALISGGYFFHKKLHAYKKEADSLEAQTKLVNYLEKIIKDN